MYLLRAGLRGALKMGDQVVTRALWSLNQIIEGGGNDLIYTIHRIPI